MQENIPVTLKLLGFNETEIKVYLTLLKLGKTSSSVLANRLKINRSTARYTLEQLHQKGLTLMMRENNTANFWVESPTKLFQLLEQENNILNNKKIQLEKIMPTLSEIVNPHKVFPRVSFFEGLEGVQRVLEDSLTSKTDILTYSDVEGYMKYLRKFNEEYYAPKRKKLGIFEKIIIPDTKTAVEYLRDYNALEVSNFIFVDHKLFPLYSEINIYDNKISFVTFSDVQHVGLLIENQEIYETQKSIFEMVWSIGAKARTSE